ncbi:virulence factor BrkB family protein [Alteromonas sp. ASW11-130]|uniref:virulence factor BrkB family protein n=1 Tax=Alteromonas sp. ASW11-130 TaxID=3015775 RepID=UPI0022424880|nr:virulence factor BrkB family protein [Alteromonas sp. ASW11-130]
MNTDRVKAVWHKHHHRFRDFGRIFVQRCANDNITISAGHLAYVTLLSLVPFVMVTFTMMSAFPAFASVRSKLEHFIFTNFVPTASDVVHEHILSFVANAAEMSAIGILSLLVVALLLISNVDKTLNRIWRTPSERPLIYTLAIYWMVITLSPMLIGSSVVVTSYLSGIANFAEEYTPGLGTTILKMVPSLTTMLAFVILYMLVPNRRVSPKYALPGALVATILFEIMKNGFTFYVTNFPSYQVIYGALATLPILFLWVYLSWIVVLVGAEFTCSLNDTFDEHKASEEPRELPNE